MAVLPLLRWRGRLRLDATCLVIGSMAPDFEYFARGKEVSRISHTLPGLAIWCIPVTLLTAALVHFLCKWPVLLVAPAPLARQAIAAARRPWPGPLSAACIGTLVGSATLGSISHLIWDGVTHANGWFVRHLPGLTTVYVVPGLGALPLHRLLQHLSTVVGLATLGLVGARHWIRRSPAVPTGIARTWPRLGFAAAILGAAALTTARNVHHHETDIGSLVVGVISGLIAGTVIASVLARAAGERFRSQVVALDNGSAQPSV